MYQSKILYVTVLKKEEIMSSSNNNTVPIIPIKEVIPSVENRARLKVLSKEFRPKNTHFFVAPHIKSSMEACMASAVGMTERVKKFIESGFSHEKAGLDPTKYVHETV